jgi:hypothetical protein
MKSILDPSFKYVDSAHTNLRKTFERIRREQQPPPQPAPALPSNVVPLYTGTPVPNVTR